MSSNDPMSILLATTILALGGFGLYMYKSSDDGYDHEHNKDEQHDNKRSNNDENEEAYNEDTLFSWFSLGEKDEKDKDEKIEDELEENEVIVSDAKHRKRTGKTLKNRRTYSSSRRRY